MKERKFNPAEYAQKYKKENYDSILVLAPKGKKEMLKQKATENGLSLNAFMVSLIEKALSEDNKQ